MDCSIITALMAGLFGSGFCSLLTFLIQRSDKKKDKKGEKLNAQGEMLMGLGHDRITYLGAKYLERGSITVGEYENLSKYLYQPYKRLGGNGTAEKIMNQVNELPVSDKSEVIKNEDDK